MSKFRVGQRVRIVGEWRGKGQSPQGHEGVIVDGPGRFAGECTKGPYTWLVSSDAVGLLVANSPDLEPAADSYDVTTWDQCVWQPEHLRVEA